MKILLVEDNHLKRERIIEFLRELGEEDVEEAGSYNSGLLSATENNFDLIILDMSMPTFDRTESDTGGRFRTFAGWDIIKKLKKKNRAVSFVIVTGYAKFSDQSMSLGLDEIHDYLNSLSDKFLGVIYYDTSNAEWKEKLQLVIRRIINA